MEIKQGYWLTASGGKDWVVYQPKEKGNFYRVFQAENFNKALNIALIIIEQTQR